MWGVAFLNPLLDWKAAKEKGVFRQSFVESHFSTGYGGVAAKILRASYWKEEWPGPAGPELTPNPKPHTPTPTIPSQSSPVSSHVLSPILSAVLFVLS